IELNAGYAQAHYWYAVCLASMGREREALEEIRVAHELDPLSPSMNMLLGELLANNQLFDQAIERFHKTQELNANSGMASVHLAVVLLYQKKFTEGLAELDRADKLMPGARPIQALRGYAYAQSGRRPEALGILRQLTGPSAPKFGTAFDLPALYLGLGDKD